MIASFNIVCCQSTPKVRNDNQGNFIPISLIFHFRFKCFFEQGWGVFIDAGNGGSLDGAIRFCREVLARIERDQKDAVTLKVSATPEYFVNGRPLPSFGQQQLLDLVREELEKAY